MRNGPDEPVHWGGTIQYVRTGPKEKYTIPSDRKSLDGMNLTSVQWDGTVQTLGRDRYNTGIGLFKTDELEFDPK